MSNTQPQSRAELKEYIKMKLGAPVIKVNLDDTQFDLAIDDAFQYFYERQHFDAIEKTYLSIELTDPMVQFLKTFEVEEVAQSDTQQRYAEGMVDTLTLTSPGSKYAAGIVTAPTTGGSGEGLVVNVGEARTTGGGLISVTVYETGTGYQVGDVITVSAGDQDATFTVATVKTQSALHGTELIRTQNNYVVLPEGVIGVNQILGHNTTGMMGGGLPGAALFNPFLGGSAASGSQGFTMANFYSMRQYLADLQWNLYPPKSYSYNKRTRRLYLNTKDYAGAIKTGGYLVFECDIKANPDFSPEVYNDMFMKELAVAYTQITWGRVLTKYQQVQLPGGITLNGQEILQEGQEAARVLKERFALDYADPVLDMVG